MTGMRILVATLAALPMLALAVDAVPLATGAPAVTSTEAASAERADAGTAQLWGLTLEEVKRANALLRGPRAAFSNVTLTPLEALGIHARSEAERQRYAEMFVRALHADLERVLAFERDYEAAWQRLYPNEPVVDFTGQSARPGTSAGMADAANVPRAAVKPVAPGARGASR